MDAVRKLDKKLGIGARGVVYQGFDEDNGWFVAIKEIPLIESSFANEATPPRTPPHRAGTGSHDTPSACSSSANSSRNDEEASGVSGQAGGAYGSLSPQHPYDGCGGASESQTEEEAQATLILREIRVMERAKHPNLVRYYGTRRSAVGVQLIMEYVGGGSLESLLRRCGALRERVVRRYTQDILHGLVYLHDVMKVCHRDIKPGNVLLTTTGECKLADFGVSKILGGGGVGSSPPGTGQRRSASAGPRETDHMRTTVGTPWYMAPEVISGGVDDDDLTGLDQEMRRLLPPRHGEHEGYSTAADIWSLGVTVFEMLSGERPFGHGLHNPTAVLFHIVNTAATEVPQLPERCHVSQEARDFLDLCFVYDRTLRPSARELLTHAWFAREGHAARGGSTPRTTTDARPFTTTPPRRPPHPTVSAHTKPGKFSGALDTFDVASVTAAPASSHGATLANADVNATASTAHRARHSPPLPSPPQSKYDPTTSARSPITSRVSTATGTNTARSSSRTAHSQADPAAARYACLRECASRIAGAATPRQKGGASVSTGLWTRDGYYVDLVTSDPLEDL